jgi:glycosyltransferase involved in cell wall biosynthesis
MTVFITPGYHDFKKLVLDRTLIPRVAKRADAIITVSNSARYDILRHLKVPREKVKVIMGAVSSHFRPIVDPAQLDSVKAKYGLHQPFILYVGTIEPRKNLTRLIQAFADLKKSGLPHKLVIVGQSGWHVGPIFAEVERLGLTKDIIFTGYVPIEDLPALYSLCESMAFPSLYEGFGLPVLEAMACGAAVVTSRSSSLIEVAGDAALLVNPLSVAEIADSLRRLHLDPNLRAELRVQGIVRASHFTWEAAARSTLDLYEKVAGHTLATPVLTNGRGAAMRE